MQGRVEDLIQEVSRRAGNGSALAHLSTAVELAADLTAAADELVDHFVADARKQGCSWADIGRELGVSKQGAQQRFVSFDLSAASCREVEGVLTPRARRALRQAHKEARRMRVRYVDTEHILVGLLRDPRALAVKVLHRMGIDPGDVEREVARQLTSKQAMHQPSAGTLVPAAVGALQRALVEAEGLGHNYVGTEHLLLGLMSGPGTACNAVNGVGGDYTTARQKALELLNGADVVIERRRLRARMQPVRPSKAG